jgi:hypothetical protein
VIWLIAMPPLLQRLGRQRVLPTEEPSDTDAEQPSLTAERESSNSPPPNPYEGAAFVTLAGGDASARNLVALLQSFRDVGTTLPIVILLARGGLGSAACHNSDWKKSVNRPSVDCSGPDTIAEEIVSPEFIAIYKKLGAEIRVIPWIPRTQYTISIPGGKESFWGYSLNRLV